MSPVQDANVVVRAVSDGAFAADSAISVELFGTALKGMALNIVVPAVQGSLPTLTVDIHAASLSVCATTDVMIGSRALGVLTAALIAVNNPYIIPFSTRMRSVCFAFRIGGGSTPSFSLMTAWVSLNTGHEWTRTVEFV